MNGTMSVFEVPSWAVAYGEDRFGLFADLEVMGVVQRMRWIPPGTFVQGSPKHEAGHQPWEEKARIVHLTRGFWLGDTPVTQAHLEAVTGSNPSRFKSDDRPVDRARYTVAMEFLQGLRALFPNSRWRLPNEAEWEYACRAGTTSATYVGDIVIEGNCNAPRLDEIAWYSGNAGLNFELGDRGHDLSKWSARDHDDEQWGGTHPVKQLAPNAWGLYDMLGNVWETCEDRCGQMPAEYAPNSVTDPRPAADGEWHVVRGGSWFSLAAAVRAAYRDYDGFPSEVDDELGFRIAEG